VYVLVLNRQTDPAGEVYVFDTVAGHRRTGMSIMTFLDRPDLASLSFPAAGRCPLLPDAEFLCGVRIERTAGPILTQRLPGAVLRVSGSTGLLRRYAKEFVFAEGAKSGHRHPETAFSEDELDPGTEMIVLEAADELEEGAEGPKGQGPEGPARE
jgi:hypothetical protein